MLPAVFVFGDDGLMKTGKVIPSVWSISENALHTKRKIMEEVSEFCRTNFHDDATLLVVAVQ